MANNHFFPQRGWVPFKRARSGGGVTPPDYIVTNDAQWDAVMANSDATLSGKTMAISGTNFTIRTLTARNFATPFTITSLNSGSEMPGLTITGCTNLTCSGLNFQMTGWPATRLNIIQFNTGTNTNLKFRSCKFRHGYGASHVAFDPSATYTEYTRVDNVQSATIASVRYALTFQDAAATGAWIEFFNRGAANVYYKLGDNTVVATAADTLAIPSLDSVRSASFNPQTTTHVAIIAASGVQQINARTEIGLPQYLASGFASQSNVTQDALEITDCTFDSLNNGIKGVSAGTVPNDGLANITIFARNTFMRMYQDIISIGKHKPATGKWLLIYDNQTQLPAASSGIAEGAPGDARDPHGDLFQIGSVGPIDTGNIIYTGNRIIPTTRRAGATTQGVFISDTDTAYRDIYVIANQLLGRSSRGVSIGEVADMEACYIAGNTVLSYETVVTPVAIFGSLQNPSGDNSFAWKNAAQDISSVTGFNDLSNTIINTANPTATFPAWAGLATAVTAADIDTALVATDRGASALRSTFFDAAGSGINVIKWANMHPGTIWSNVLNATESAPYTLPCRKILAGTPTTPVIPGTGVSWQSTSDRAGASVVTAYTTSSGTIARGEYLWLRRTMPAGSLQTVTIAATVNGFTVGADVTTADLAVFDIVDNQAAAYSTMPPRGTTDPATKIVIAWRAKADNIVASARHWGSNNGNWAFYYSTTGQLRWQFGSSAQIGGRTVTSVDTGWHTYALVLDIAQAAFADGCKLYIDGVAATITNPIWVPNASYELGLNSVNGLFGTASLGLFVQNGANILDGQMAFWWADWGGSGYSLPDFSNPATWSKLSPSMIGTNGQGVTGSTPKRYYTGTAAAWNANLANKGTDTGLLTKIAGTYV